MKIVEKIRKKELAVKNDGSQDDLHKVLNFVFPNDRRRAAATSKYYKSSSQDLNAWQASNKKTMPTVSVKEVLAEIEPAHNPIVGSVTKQPLGLTPKKFHEDAVKKIRLNEIREAIVRYYDAELEIDIAWIEEYNELINRNN